MASFNPLDSKDNYSATSSNTKLVHWPLMGGLLHLVQRGGAWVSWGPAQSPLSTPRQMLTAYAVPRQLTCWVLKETVVINPLAGTLKPHSNRPIYGNTVISTLAVDGPLFCGFNGAIKWLMIPSCKSKCLSVCLSVC